MKNIEDMGFMYIAEQTSPEDYKITNMDVVNKNGVFFVKFDTCLQSFEVINRNNRQYLMSNIRDCFQTERLQALLADNALYGEMDHPLQEFKNQPLTPERINTIEMSRRSHKIMNPDFKNNMLYAHIETASGTEAGRGFASEIIQGLNPAFSCRALAGLQLINNKPTVIVRKVITYDWVLYPSHKEAHKVDEAQGVVKKIKTVTESVADNVKKYSKDILLPLKEILENVGHKDVNMNLIMESFELSEDEFVGFDVSKHYGIFNDGTNQIYCRMNPDSVKEVKDFYSSFNI